MAKFSCCLKIRRCISVPVGLVLHMKQGVGMTAALCTLQEQCLVGRVQAFACTRRTLCSHPVQNYVNIPSACRALGLTRHVLDMYIQSGMK